MQFLVILITNSLYRDQIRKENEEGYQCKSEMWLMTENDERFLVYQKINYGNFVVKMKDEAGLKDEGKKFKTMPLRLGAFLLSNSKGFMNNFIHAIRGFYSNDVYYTDTDSYLQTK